MSLLSAADLQAVTGRSQPAAQIRWLRKMGVRHLVNANGRPVVTWAAINGDSRPAPAPAPIRWDAINGPAALEK